MIDVRTPEGAPPPATQSAETASPRKKTMSEAALAANRANARKSTGPRTAAGKLKSASNSLQHGLYSLHNVEHFAESSDVALAVTSNVLEQFQPITPSEHFLAQQLIHQQLRFLQMQYLYNQSMFRTVDDIMNKPAPFLNAVMRELDALPGRISRAIKALHSEIAQRERVSSATSDEKFEIEPIPSPEKLPVHPDHQHSDPPRHPGSIRTGLLFDLFTDHITRKYTNFSETNPSSGEVVAVEEIVDEQPVQPAA